MVWFWTHIFYSKIKCLQSWSVAYTGHIHTHTHISSWAPRWGRAAFLSRWRILNAVINRVHWVHASPPKWCSLMNHTVWAAGTDCLTLPGSFTTSCNASVQPQSRLRASNQEASFFWPLTDFCLYLQALFSNARLYASWKHFKGVYSPQTQTHKAVFCVCVLF